MRDMEYNRLGKTGLSVSVMSLGTGGHSRIGQSTGRTKDESVRVIKEAVDLGINLIDSSEAYGTEDIVGKAILDIHRDKVVLTTKCSMFKNNVLKSAPDLVDSLNASLKRLNIDYVDVYMLHAVNINEYDYAVRELVPAMIKMKAAGKIGFLGITETFASDTDHKTLTRAVNDDIWDVMMVGFNILNYSAANYILKESQQKDIGIMDMFAVRRALVGGQPLFELVSELIDKGFINKDKIDLDDPLGFVVNEYGCKDLTEAAYRYCRYELGIDTVLSGTGNIMHLKQNITSILREPLPKDCVLRLKDIFKDVDSVSGN